jgi:hypothetical protein
MKGGAMFPNWNFGYSVVNVGSTNLRGHARKTADVRVEPRGGPGFSTSFLPQ